MSGIILFIIACMLPEKVISISVGSDEGESNETSENESGESGGIALDECIEGSLPSEIVVDADCRPDVSQGLLSTSLLWNRSTFQQFQEYTHVLMMPIVGQLTDDNGDGAVDDLDTPDVLVVMDDGGIEPQTHGVMRIISGATGEELSSWLHIVHPIDQVFAYRYSGLALGDIDSDGETEIVGFAEVVPGVAEEPEEEPIDDEDSPIKPPPPTDPGQPPTGPSAICRPFAIELDGSLLWISDAYHIDCGGHHPVLADLEGDGSVEVVIGSAILNGLDGSAVGLGMMGDARHEAYDYIGSVPIVIDLDGDGMQEVISGNSVYDDLGGLRCGVLDLPDGYPAAADFNGDGRGQFVVVGNGQIWVADANCDVSAAWSLLDEGTGGPPVVADFDQDGLPEIGVSSALHYAVYEPDGTLLWSHPTVDESSHATGSSVADLEGDGRLEILYADEFTFWIFDAMTGAVRLEDHSHTSRTLHEYPMVVDLDGDKKPEILLPNGGTHGQSEAVGLMALESSSDDWLGGPISWNQHAYYLHNQAPNSHIPGQPLLPWESTNSFRSSDLNPPSMGKGVDAAVSADICSFECDDGFVSIVIRVENRGAATMRSGVGYGVWRVDQGSPTALIEQGYTDSYLAAGEGSDPIFMDIPIDQIGSDGIMVIVDDDNGVDVLLECDELNNYLHLPEVVCSN